MVSKTDRKAENKEAVTLDEYRENVRKMMMDEVQQAIDEELGKAALELREEERKAIEIVAEEQKAAIKQVVEEEKKSIWQRAEMLKQSILKIGL